MFLASDIEFQQRAAGIKQSGTKQAQEMAATGFPASCFGKLPSFADFVRHNAGNREMLAFDQWLQQGLLAAKAQLRQNWEADYDAAPVQHFLFCSANTDHLLAGMLQPSHDKSERRYPFWVSWLIERSYFNGMSAVFMPILLASRLALARQLADDARNGLGVNNLTTSVANLTIPATDDFACDIRYFQNHLASDTCAGFWQRALGNFSDPRKYLLFKNLCEILLPYRQGRLDELTLGLRFPLTNDAEFATYDVSFWIQMSLELARNSSFIPIYFWSQPEPGKKAFLFLFFRTPSAKSFVQLLRPEIASDGICELDEEGRDKIILAEQALPSLYRSLLQRPELTLKEFLQRL